MVRVGASIAEDPWYALNETGHLVLDVVGFVPGIGIVADGVNAIWYLAEGRELEAAISGFAAIPGIGYLGAGAQLGKYTGRIAKGARFVSEAVTGIRRGGRLYDVSRAADIGLNVGVSAYFGVQGYHNNNPLQVGLSVAGLGINGIAIARWGRVATASPRTVSPNVLQPRLAGGATNPALAQRFLAYQAWKRNAGITGRPTLSQFKRFMGAHRPGSRGVTLYPKNTSGFAAWRRMAGRVHGHHALPRQFADDFAEIGIRNLDDFIYPVAARHHLSVVHRGVGGGVYNAWWKKFLTTDAYGPTNAENTLRWLELHRQNNFVVKL